MNKVTHKQFKQFLKFHLFAHANYLQELEAAGRPGLKKVFKTHGARQVLLGSFFWENSEQGHGYWSNLNQAWQKYLDIRGVECTK